MKPLKDKVSITLASDLIAQLKILAESDDRSFSQYINKILKEYLKYKKERNIIASLMFLSNYRILFSIHGMQRAYIGIKNF